MMKKGKKLSGYLPATKNTSLSYMCKPIRYSNGDKIGRTIGTGPKSEVSREGKLGIEWKFSEIFQQKELNEKILDIFLFIR